MTTGETLSAFTHEGETHQEANMEGLDSREVEVIRNGNFFEAYKEELKGLFDALEISDRWSEDPREMMAYITAQWIGQDHGNSAEKAQFTPEQTEAAMPYLVALGLAGEIRPAPQHFSSGLVGGATTLAIVRRARLADAVKEDGSKIDELNYLLGQRPRIDRDRTNDEILGRSGDLMVRDISEDPFVERHLNEPLVASAEALALAKVGEAVEADRKWDITETELGLAALHGLEVTAPHMYKVELPIVGITNSGRPLAEGVEAMPHEAHMPKEVSKRENVPAREVIAREFETFSDDEATPGQMVRVINAPAVSRGEGREARPTTDSTMKEWIDRYAPLPDAENKNVVLFTSNPHAIRMAQAAYKAMQELGRSDLILHVAATAPPANTSIQSYLGEVGRLLKHDPRVIAREAA